MPLKSKEFYKILEEQMTFEFNGRINILTKHNAQLLGHMILKEGKLLRITYKNIQGIKACLVLAQDEASGIIRYVIEPEIIEDSSRNIFYSFNDLFNLLEEYLKRSAKSSLLRPSDELKLFIRPEFIIEGATITQNEFEVLHTLSDYQSVGEVYNRCKLLDFEITHALVSLRNKKALKVMKAI